MIILPNETHNCLYINYHLYSYQIILFTQDTTLTTLKPTMRQILSRNPYTGQLREQIPFISNQALTGKLNRA